ncbi:MAG: nucleotidyl transferase AbiEii/AbiGii toxin family protein [Anaerolineaceae bacterium]|nr:nucleotidyl transferase AbiEii/AbiGii toxin family protein [Anaerolineaceae bacterium]
MKTTLKRLVQKADSKIQAGNLVREYLQVRILESLQNTGGMIPLAFQGGTALRFLYDLPRFSEDLDFALERPKVSFDIQKSIEKILRVFIKENYTVKSKLNTNKVVHSAFIQFPGLLYELGLSGQPKQILAIKLEVDTNPPAGAGLDTTLVRRYVVLRLQHYDRASLLAGKLHALLKRDYVKGRDVYDLFWYLSNRRWPEPNLILLNNALDQTGWKGKDLSKDTWRKAVQHRIEAMSWERVIDDVAPFLEKEAELELLTQENLLSLLNLRNSQTKEDRG